MIKLKTTIARHGRLPQKSPAQNILRILLISALFVVLSVVGIFGSAVYNLVSSVETFSIVRAPKRGDSNVQKLAEPFKGGVNILLIGSDDRTGQGAEFGEGRADASGKLNDVNMLFSISPDQSAASVISIPRDTLVDVPECIGDDGEKYSRRHATQINSLLSRGGAGCIIQTVEQMSGMSVNYAAIVKFRGVIEMSNAVGGVNVCVAKPIHDRFVNLHLPAGVHSLQGAEALKFLRSRYGIGDGSDLNRITNQQVFLSALLRTIKSGGALYNPVKLYSIARAVVNNMALSSDLASVDTVVSIARALAKIPTEKISLVRLPVMLSPTNRNRVEPSSEAVKMWAALREGRPLIAAPKVKLPQQTATYTSTPDGSASEDSALKAGTSESAESRPEPTVPHLHLSGQNATEETCSNAN